jgi:hypothetical protein
MQDGVLNLCRVKLRDQQRLDKTHVMEEYPQYPNGQFGDAVPRAGATRPAAASRDGFSNAWVGRRTPCVHLLHHASAGVEGHL